MATTYNTPTIDSAIRFKAGTYANLPAERDSSTLYFCTDTQQLFVGTDEYTRRLKTGAGAPSADATGTPTNGFYWDSTNNELYSNINGTWTKIGTVKTMGAATASTAGTAGLVPAPAAGEQTSFLRGDGTWAAPSGTTYTAATSVAAETVGTTAVVGTSENYARQDHVHAMPGIFGAATASEAGTAGFVPAPGANKHTSFLRGDGTWVVPTDTNTHNTAYLYAGASGTGSNATTTNGNTTLVLKDGNDVTSNIKIKGTGLMSVVSDDQGEITISTTATDNIGTVTKVKMNGVEKSPTSGIVDLGTVITAHQSLSDYATLSSPAFTGTPTAPTAAAGTNNTQIATTAFVMEAFTANDAMIFKGTIGSSGATVTALPSTHKQGWTYKVATAGTYAGNACEIGDMIICVTDGTSDTDSHWAVIQNNIDGAVIGPASVSNNTNNNVVAVFNGASGKVIKDSGFTIGKSVPSDAVFTDTTYTAATDVAAETVSATAVVGTSENYARQDHVHAMPGTFGAATASEAGTAGFVPAPAAGEQASFLRGDGTWAAPNNTTYTNASLGQGYGTCATEAATAAKVVTLSNYDLTVGGVVAVKFTNAVPANATMNVNSSGAKNIFANGSAITDNIIKAGDIATFMYDGTQYQLLAIDIPYESKSAASGGTELSFVTTGEKYTWNNKSNLTIGDTSTTAAAGNHTHTTTLATDTGTSNITLGYGSKYKLSTGGTSTIFTMPSLGTSSTTAAAGNHTHTLSLATTTDDSSITLSPATKYKLTAGGSTYVFTTPSDTKVTSTLTSSGTTKIFLTGMAQATAATATSAEQHNGNVYVMPNTGILYAATPTAGTNDTSVATTAYVTTAISDAALVWGSF